MLSRRQMIYGLALIGLSACKDKAGQFQETGGMMGNLDQYPIEDLNRWEQAGILQLREEEKLARDVYTTLDAKWGLRAFGMIKNAEQRHMDAMAKLINRYDLLDPAKSQVGAFTDPKMQSLYETLVGQGERSSLDALGVGMTVEDLDIYDIDQVLLNNDNQDIALVFGNLRQGSVMHMRRFYSDLKVSGGNYTPKYITQAQFDGIVSGI